MPSLRRGALPAALADVLVRVCRKPRGEGPPGAPQAYAWRFTLSFPVRGHLGLEPGIPAEGSEKGDHLLLFRLGLTLH